MLKKTVIVTLGCLLAASTVNVHAMERRKHNFAPLPPSKLPLKKIKSKARIGAAATILFFCLSCASAKKLFWDKNPNKNKILLSIGFIFCSYLTLCFFCQSLPYFMEARSRRGGVIPEPTTDDEDDFDSDDEDDFDSEKTSQKNKKFLDKNTAGTKKIKEQEI